jgi:hypothetical protein
MENKAVEGKTAEPDWYDDWLKYMQVDDVRPSHKFIIEKARQFPPGTTHGLNSLPYVLMPAVAFAMEEYSLSLVEEKERRIKELETEVENLKTSLKIFTE